MVLFLSCWFSAFDCHWMCKEMDQMNTITRLPHSSLWCIWSLPIINASTLCLNFFLVWKIISSTSEAWGIRSSICLFSVHYKAIFLLDCQSTQPKCGFPSILIHRVRCPCSTPLLKLIFLDHIPLTRPFCDSSLPSAVSFAFLDLTSQCHAEVWTQYSSSTFSPQTPSTLMPQCSFSVWLLPPQYCHVSLLSVFLNQTVRS